MQVEGPAGARGVGATVGVLAALATAAGATALAVRRRQAARPESRGYEPEEPTLAASPPPVPTLGPSLAASSPSVPTAEPTPVPTPAPPTPLIPAAGVLRAQLEAVADPRLADATFGAEELARAMATSRRTLHRRMMAAGLEAPSQWLQERRLLAGRRLLRERRCTTVGEAAAAVGLSRTWFADAYSERFGHPPSEELRGPPS
jgi:AraC-like DNA-binding protein